MKTYNIPRSVALGLRQIPNSIWVSISEPDIEHISNLELEKSPTLKIRFWDLINPVPEIGTNNILYPPNEEDAKRIVDFIIQNPNKHVITNCKQGKCRSGAVSQFCHDMIGMEWDAESERRAVPNHLLYRMMVDYFLKSGNLPPTKIIDKRKR